MAADALEVGLVVGDTRVGAQHGHGRRLGAFDSIARQRLRQGAVVTRRLYVVRRMLVGVGAIAPIDTVAAPEISSGSTRRCCSRTG